MESNLSKLKNGQIKPIFRVVPKKNTTKTKKPSLVSKLKPRWMKALTYNFHPEAKQFLETYLNQQKVEVNVEKHVIMQKIDFNLKISGWSI